MQDGSNKAILYNSIILYVRLGIVALCQLFTTRFSLQALGVVDFGLFSLLAGVIAIVVILNNIMMTTTYRFIAVELGKKDIRGANVQFNVSLIIHAVIAVITVVLAIPIGDWYINNFLVFDGDFEVARWVYRISVIGSVLSFVGVPYNGVLVAKEQFIIPCCTDILTNLGRLIVSYILISHFQDKLIIYAIATALFTAYPTWVFVLYCRRKFKDIVKFHLVCDKKKYKEVLSFSTWVGFGAFAFIARNQGAAILVNGFFSTVLNTALGIGNTVNTMLNQISNAISQPIAPQITKSYAADDFNRSTSLLILSIKATFLLTLMVIFIISIDIEWVLSLWLVEVPPYAVSFTILLMVDTLIQSLNSGISNIIFASGRIKRYQIITNTFRLSAIIIAYFVLRSGAAPYFLLLSYITTSFFVLLSNQWLLKKEIGLDNMLLFKKAYLPSILVVLFLLPSFFLLIIDCHILKLLIAWVYCIACIFYVGLSNNERNLLIVSIKNKIHSI